jgi:hypothetical protein
MLANHEPNWKIDDLSDTEVYAAIRYLEPDTRSADEENDDVSVLICVGLYLLLTTNSVPSSLAALELFLVRPENGTD